MPIARILSDIWKFIDDWKEEKYTKKFYEITYVFDYCSYEIKMTAIQKIYLKRRFIWKVPKNNTSLFICKCESFWIVRCNETEFQLWDFWWILRENTEKRVLNIFLWILFDLKHKPSCKSCRTSFNWSLATIEVMFDYFLHRTHNYCTINDSSRYLNFINHHQLQFFESAFASNTNGSSTSKNRAIEEKIAYTKSTAKEVSWN